MTKIDIEDLKEDLITAISIRRFDLAAKLLSRNGLASIYNTIQGDLEFSNQLRDDSMTDDDWAEAWAKALLDQAEEYLEDQAARAEEHAELEHEERRYAERD